MWGGGLSAIAEPLFVNHGSLLNRHISERIYHLIPGTNIHLLQSQHTCVCICVLATLTLLLYLLWQVSAYCYNGECRTHQSQCRLWWGDDADNAMWDCYHNLNGRGVWSANCGYNATSRGYVYARCLRFVSCFIQQNRTGLN